MSQRKSAGEANRPPTPEITDRPLLPEEAAQILGIPVDRLIALAEAGVITGCRLGKIWRFSLWSLTMPPEPATPAAA